MIDEITADRLTVSADSVAGPYLIVRLAQLEHVTSLLDHHGIRYWVDFHAISLDGQPATTVVNFGRNGHADQIQQILDQVESESPRGAQ